MLLISKLVGDASYTVPIHVVIKLQTMQQRPLLVNLSVLTRLRFQVGLYIFLNEYDVPESHDSHTLIRSWLIRCVYIDEKHNYLSLEWHQLRVVKHSHCPLAMECEFYTQRHRHSINVPVLVSLFDSQMSCFQDEENPTVSFESGTHPCPFIS